MEGDMTDSAEAWLDDLDQAILDQLAALQDRLDPPPADLDERTRFAIALDEVEIEVARLSDDLLVGSGARADERTRTITFEADSRTIMVTVAERPDGLVRIDGWLAPVAALRVELRIAGQPDAQPRSEFVISDDSGRFVFDDVPRGLAQLLVSVPEDGASPRVVTPSLVL
jgi:hypothetical protein